MPVVPGTKVQVDCFSFGHPPTQTELKKREKQQPPLYYPKLGGTLRLASVNAGNSGSLYVGGDGVNLAFAKHLNPPLQHVDDFANRHIKLLAKADKAGSAQWEAYSSTDPCAFSYVNPSRVNQIAGSNEGVCFVDVFDISNAVLCPDSNAMNVAMLYVAPPQDETYLKEASQDHAAATASFIAAIQALAVNIIKTISAYNALAAQQKQPVIQALRNTLYSSGIYNQTLNVPRPLIARTIFAGFTAELNNDQHSGLEELQFPVGSNVLQDDLFLAVQQDLAAPSKGSAA